MYICVYVCIVASRSRARKPAAPLVKDGCVRNFPVLWLEVGRCQLMAPRWQLKQGTVRIS